MAEESHLRGKICHNTAGGTPARKKCGTGKGGMEQVPGVREDRAPEPGGRRPMVEADIVLHSQCSEGLRQEAVK